MHVKCLFLVLLSTPFHSTHKHDIKTISVNKIKDSTTRHLINGLLTDTVIYHLTLVYPIKTHYV